MHFWNLKSVRFKIVFYTSLCLAAVGILSNLYLYTYMSQIITKKIDAIDTLYLDTIQLQLDAQMTEMQNLAALCASSPEVARAMRATSLESLSARKSAVHAQSVLNDYLHSFNLDGYVNKLLVCNENGVVVQAVAQQDGSMQDFSYLQKSDVYARRHQREKPFSMLIPSITQYKGKCLSGIFPVGGAVAERAQSYVYIELSPAILTDILDPYATLNPIFVGTANDEKIIDTRWASEGLRSLDLTSFEQGEILTDDERRFKVDTRALHTANLTIYNCTDLDSIMVDNQKMTYTMIVMIASVLVASICTLMIISTHITRPIHKLIARIKRISENDFSFDPEIERSGDEIADIGKVVNEMTLSINNLLQQNNEQNEQKKNIEIDLLQSQVNPHFLYNTLDSIHWMAVIQKNPGICNITRSLSNLLKNMAKGFSQKITLEEELNLLQDYITIQSIRYLETFEFVNRISKEFYHYKIVKLTLQPLVENAIFHGIEPSGVCGTISLEAREDGEFLLITVSDTGVGMTAEELEKVMNTAQQRTRNSMNGIGMGNVDKRLKLVYGAPCGLVVESEKDKGTSITVRIRREEVI